MSITTEIIEGIAAFVKTATNFSAIIESNVDSYYRMHDKRNARRQIESIENVLKLFPQIWFFNGMFAVSFLDDVNGADGFATRRDGPAISQFETMLDDVERVFEREAPHIRGLGADMVCLFKRQISIRRDLILAVKNWCVFTEEDISYIVKLLKPLQAVEHRFFVLNWQFRDDFIRDAALQNPALNENALAKRLGESPFVVRAALSKKGDSMQNS